MLSFESLMRQENEKKGRGKLSVLFHWNKIKTIEVFFLSDSGRRWEKSWKAQNFFNCSLFSHLFKMYSEFLMRAFLTFPQTIFRWEKFHWKSYWEKLFHSRREDSSGLRWNRKSKIGHRMYFMMKNKVHYSLYRNLRLSSDLGYQWKVSFHFNSHLVLCRSRETSSSFPRTLPLPISSNSSLITRPYR